VIPITKQKLIQIELTNTCINQCANCTRFVGHHRKPFMMDIPTFEKALDTLHTEFKKILKIFRERVPDRRKRELWTAGYKWKEYAKDIKETFDDDLISYNDHSQTCGKHAPILASLRDLVRNPKEREELIENCWVQPRWSSSITPFGCYFCEIAGAMDIMFTNGKNAWPLEKGWWKRSVKEFDKQKKAICPNCGINIPIGDLNDKATYDVVSRGNLCKLKKLRSPKVISGNYAEYNKQWTAEQIKSKFKSGAKPWVWRSFYAHTPSDVAKATGKRADTDKKQS
jgi:hypothetical protein